jgi:hypothetical protein
MPESSRVLPPRCPRHTIRLALASPGTHAADHRPGASIAVIRSGLLML